MQWSDMQQQDLDSTGCDATLALRPDASPADVPQADAPQGGARYFNRELSWLNFNRRVLEEAMNPAHPSAATMLASWPSPR